jgi:hypothetical protein
MLAMAWRGCSTVANPCLQQSFLQEVEAEAAEAAAAAAAEEEAVRSVEAAAVVSDVMAAALNASIKPQGLLTRVTSSIEERINSLEVSHANLARLLA